MRLFETIAENEDFIAVNKSAGLLSIPDRAQATPTLKGLLQEKLGQVFTVHRLDKDTSGIIVFAKTPEAHAFLSGAFEHREVDKQYLGMVVGSLPSKTGTINESIAEHPGKKGTMVIHRRGKPSVTEYEEVETFGMMSWVRFRIHTGRTHQIRVHMQYTGHPIICDQLYGNGQPIYLSSLKRGYKQSRSLDEERPLIHRLGLHASRISFQDTKGRDFALEAPLPKDLKALLQQLHKWTT